jgi:hypothetical protein
MSSALSKRIILVRFSSQFWYFKITARLDAVFDSSARAISQYSRVIVDILRVSIQV